MKLKENQTQSDIALTIGQERVYVDIDNFKKRYFACLKQRAEH